MNYRIDQSSEYAGKNYWRWSAWIEADDAALDAVDEVVWILHPTFPKSRRHSRDRVSKFRLETAGWGTFLLRAEVMLKQEVAAGQKRTVSLEHQLQLEDPAARAAAGFSGAAKRSVQPRVFLSYSKQDMRHAARLRETFENEGIEVLDQSRLDTGQVWGDVLQRMIRESDAVVGIVSEDEISPMVVADMDAAANNDKPIIAVLGEKSAETGIPGAARKVRVSQFHSLDVADLLRLKT